MGFNPQSVTYPHIMIVLILYSYLTLAQSRGHILWQGQEFQHPSWPSLHVPGTKIDCEAWVHRLGLLGRLGNAPSLHSKPQFSYWTGRSWTELGHLHSPVTLSCKPDVYHQIMLSDYTFVPLNFIKSEQAAHPSLPFLTVQIGRHFMLEMCSASANIKL